MSLGIRCFAGCVTPRGFVSGFEGIYEGRARVFFIKGAPGVGKSSLMRRVAARQAAQGHAVSQFLCSSDPDSLDGIADETLNAAVLDATAPHACEPELPGARDTLISLGDYLNEEALAERAGELNELARESRAAYERARHYLAAAAHIERARAQAADSRKSDLAAREILHALPVFGARKGCVRRFFLSAHTCKGEICLSGDFPPEITVSIPAPFGGDADALIGMVGEEARSRGLDCTYFMRALAPDSIAHAYLGQIPLFITTARVHGAIMTYDDLFDCEDDCARAEADALTSGARAFLARAKDIHDDIERIYQPNMDYSGAHDAENRIARALMRLKD